MKTPKNNGDGKQFPKAATPSEPHYRNLVDNAVIGIIDVTLDGKVIYANQAAAKMVGYDSPDEARKVNAISLWQDPKKREAFIAKLYEDGYVNNFEVEYITRTGKIITVLSSATLHGDVISSMVVDISEHARARSMLELSDARLRRAAEISKTGNWDLDFLTDDLFWSDEVYRIFGLPVTDSPPRYEKFLECVVPADREYVDRTWQAAICGEPYDIEHRIQVGAKVKWVREKAELDFDAAGRPVSAAGIVQDITERKKADEALGENREKLVRAEQLAHMGFLEWNLKSNQIELSNEMYNMYGLAQGIPLTFDQILALVHADDRDLVKRSLDMAVQDIHDFNMDHRIVRPDNKVIWVHGRAELKYDKDGNPFSLMGTVVDITERKEVEKKVEKYQGRLKSLALQLTLAEEQERRRLAADLHDHISQSLALTRLRLATARKGLPKNDQRDARFNEISQALLQAIQDTRHLIFELSSPSLNELGLGAAIKEWVEEQVENKHGLQAEFLDDAQGVELDDDLRAILYRNVRELLTNTIKHADAKTVSVSLEERANQLTITVQDDGKGFDPDVTFHNARSSRGFGLFSIQERMADLGGEFEIVSQPGTGCRVMLQVPIEGQTAGDQT